MLSSYRPGFWSSLVKSCYSADFYARINKISFLRSIGFLLFFSFLLSIFTFFSLWFFLSRLDLQPEGILSTYEEVVPSFDALYEGGILKTIPESFDLYFGLGPDGEVLVKNNYDAKLPFQLSIDTTQTTPEGFSGRDMPPGIYAFQEGFFATSGYGGSLFSYEDLDIPTPFSFTKESLGLLVQSGLPMLSEWLRGFFLVTAPLIIFVYSVLSCWIMALLFSLFGIVLLMVLGKELDYTLLIKLSFYATVPALVVALLTTAMSISVSFIPILVYIAYYFYGLLAYPEKN